MSAGDLTSAVSFNVGGQVYTTSTQTLLKEGNSRLALIVRGAAYCPRDATGCYLVDRDGRHFGTVLNFLRDGWCLLPASADERRELLQEIRYYNLVGFEGWMRTQEVLADAAGVSTAERTAMESPRPRTTYQPASTLSFASPSSSAPPTTSTAPRTAGLGPGSASAWGHQHGPALASHAQPQLQQAQGALVGVAHRASPMTAARGAYASSSPTRTGGFGQPAAGGAGGGGDAITALREAFLAATGPQRPAPYTAAYSLAPSADEAPGWTSKYLRGNEALRGTVNTLLELAFMPPCRVLHAGKAHVSINSSCSHAQASSLVGSKEEQGRSKLLEVRARGSLGWSFELTVRPGSDAVLWDKYEGVPATVQDNWFVLGAILKEQFGVVMEEDSAARPACTACRRTNLALVLNKIY